MIKKILLTLLFLIVLIVVGIVTLVVFVDPNNFRGFISDTVKDKTGYELTIDGDLRWHIWPQISILTDSVRLQNEGAKKPILTADNMRLDVELFPLFSKKLVVKNVLVKSAVLNITDDSKGDVAKNNKTTAVVNQTNNDTQNKNKNKSSWSFTLNKFDITDSTLVYQQNKDLINFRNINISIVQQDDKNIAVDFNGLINRDQQDFNFSLNADINLVNFPKSAQINLHNLTYDYKGVSVPSGQLKGEVKATFDYQQSPLTLDTKNFLLTLNGNSISGELKALLDKKPYFEAKLKSDKFDITPFLTSSRNNKANQPVQSQPVVTAKVANSNELAFLQNFDALFSFAINDVTVNKVTINNLVIDANNKDGIATLNKINFGIANGQVTANGQANGKLTKVAVKLNTKLSNIDLGTLLQQLELVNNLKGQLNADGHVATDTVAANKVMNALTGDLAVTINNARLENINIQNIIQTAIAQYSKESVSAEQYQKYTELHEVSANANLANGNMNLTSLKALSETLDVTGNGRIGLVKQDLDIDLEVKMLSGWNGSSKTIQQLKNIAIPVRLYGSFNEIHYKTEVSKLIKDALSSKLQNELDKLKDRLDGSTNDSSTDSSTTDQDSSKKTKAKDILGGLINKIK